jgi:hypothetical protein
MLFLKIHTFLNHGGNVIESLRRNEKAQTFHGLGSGSPVFSSVLISLISL